MLLQPLSMCLPSISCVELGSSFSGDIKSQQCQFWRVKLGKSAFTQSPVVQVGWEQERSTVEAPLGEAGRPLVLPAPPAAAPAER